jgi:hypothetical protein
MDGNTSQQPVERAAVPPGNAKSPEVLNLESQRAGGAGWLTAIAAFSVINLAILLFNGSISFVIGLGVTQLLSGFANGFAQQTDAGGAAVAWVICCTITLLIAALFVWLASRAKRGHAWAFVVGMVLYSLDGLIFLAVQDWFPFAFHIYALVMVYTGLKAHWGIAKVVASPVPHHEVSEGQQATLNGNPVIETQQNATAFSSPLLPGIASVLCLLVGGLFTVLALGGGRETQGLLIWSPLLLVGILLGLVALRS